MNTILLKTLFKSVLEDFLAGKKEYGKRLQKMGKILNYFSQFKTSPLNNGENDKKKRKVEKPPTKFLELPDDVIIEIALFVSYKSIFGIMLSNKELNSLLVKDTHSFWVRKFKMEFPELDPYPGNRFTMKYYPPFIEQWYVKKLYKENISWEEYKIGKGVWYIKTLVFLKTLKFFDLQDKIDFTVPSNRNSAYTLLQEHIFQKLPINFFLEKEKNNIFGNELLLLEICKIIKKSVIVFTNKFYYTDFIIDEYFKRNLYPNVKFLIELFKLNVYSFKHLMSSINVTTKEHRYNRQKVISNVINILINFENEKFSTILGDYHKETVNGGLFFESIIAFTLLHGENQKYVQIISSDIEIIKKIIDYRGTYLRYFSELLFDREMVLRALKSSTFQDENIDFMFMKNFVDDLKFIREAVKINGYVLKGASERFLNMYDIVFEAVKSNGKTLKILSKFQKSDPKIVLEAVKNTPIAILFSDKSLIDNNNFILELIEVNPDVIRTFKRYTEFDFLPWLNLDWVEVAMKNSDPIKNFETIQFLLTVNPFYFRFANEKTKSDIYIISYVFNLQPITLIYFNERIKSFYINDLLKMNYYSNLLEIKDDFKEMEKLLKRNIFPFYIISTRSNQKIRDKFSEEYLEILNKKISKYHRREIGIATREMGIYFRIKEKFFGNFFRFVY